MIRTQLVHHLFEYQANCASDKVAVLFPALCGGTKHETLTYRELNQRANKLARYLRDQGVQPDMLVGLFVEPSLDMIVGMLAILKAGGAYLPLDITYPQERLAFMIQDAQVSLLLTQQNLRYKLPKNDCIVISIDSNCEEIDQQCTENLESTITGDNLAYVVYTSGSTGTPKGVAITHRAVQNLVINQNYIQVNSSDIIAQASNISFDAATFEIWAPLLHGAKLVGIPKETALSPKLLATHLREQQVSVLFITTALFNQVAGDVPDAFSQLRYLLFGGEAVTPHWVAEVLKHGAPANLLHMYGPTENTTFSTWYRVNDVPMDAKTIPIGRPIANSVAYIFDENQQPVPDNTPGELYVGGLGLARGYLNREELTATRFMNTSWSGGERLYRTGDLVRCLADGNIEFLDRIDNQVKVRGFRMELGEIESALVEHPTVYQAIVIVREDQPDDKRIVAYIVPASEQVMNTNELRSLLKAKLPDYMIPQGFVYLESLPLTPNGKVDRRALPEPNSIGQESIDVVAPRTVTEANLVLTWSNVLKRQSVSIYDNFFDLGGHSLLAIQVIAQVERKFQLSLPVSQFFASPTIAEQAQWLDHTAREQGVQLPAIQASGRQGPLPLSFPQRQLWFFDQLHPFEPVYNETIVLHMPEAIEVVVLEQALNILLHRHEIFRTTFTTVKEQPAQIIHSSGSFSIRKVDLSELPLDEREATAHQLATSELKERFNLEELPLFRVTLIKLEETDWRFYLSAHHIILDGISIYNIFLPELESVYHSLVAGQPVSLPELPLQYVDFAAWQNQWLTDETLTSQLNYWKQKLANLPVLQLPTDLPYAAKTSYRGARQCLELSQELTRQLKSLSRQEGVTLFITLTTIINILLYRYTGQEDLAIGTVHSGRSQIEVQSIIGDFLNNLVLRTDVSGDPSFRELLTRVKTVVSEAYQYPDVPFEKLVNALQPERIAHQNPLFQVAFVMEPPLPTQNLHWRLSQLDIHSGTSKFDLLIELDDRPEGIIGRIEYSSDLFDDTTITRMIGHLQTLSQGVVADPDQSISRLPLLTEDEWQFLMSRNTVISYPQDTCLHDLFTAQVQRTPDNVAVVFEGSQLTYAELDQRSNQLAYYLQQHGIQSNALVAICIERSLEMVIAIYAVIKAGGAYLPIDPHYPAERIIFILEDAQPSLLLTQSHIKSQITQPLDQNCPTICIDTGWTLIQQQPKTTIHSSVTSDHVAYVIYTSGSTGKPKGVLVQHKAIVNRLLWMQDEYLLSSSDRILQKTPFTFDVSVWEFFWPLLAGACLVVARPEGHKDPGYLVDIIQREQITTLHFVPPMLSIFLEHPQVSNCRSLRQVMCSGEALAYELQERFFQRLSQAELHNLYGPTEASVDVTYWHCQRDSARRIVPIGYPVANTQIYILNKSLQPAPVGMAGELHIGGIQLAQGYLNRPQLTTEKFIPNPFIHDLNARLYKTGDLARFLSNGAIEYLGRIDHQVKLHGLRIEIGEIESVLGQHTLVCEVVVMVRTTQANNKQLVAYVVPHQPVVPGREQSLIAEMRTFCLSKLPQGMVPAVFVFLDKLPLTLAGKVDRRALPEPDLSASLRISTFVAPQTSTEKLLTEIWSEVLGISQVSIHDNFFNLGGDSMRAIQVLAQTNQHGIDLSLAQLFEQQTIYALAKLCKSQPETATKNIVQVTAFSLISGADRQKLPDDVEDAFPLSVLQAGMIYHTERDPGTDVYHDLMGSRICLPLVLGELRQVLKELSQRHPVLRTSIALMGFSEPLQLIHRDVTIPLMVEDLQHLSFVEQEKVIDGWFIEEKQQGFDWQKAPLLCVKIHQRDTNCFNLTLSFHHIILEGWSIAMLVTELFQLYLAALRKETTPLAPPPVSLFRDFVATEQRVVQSETAKNYWINKFADKPLSQLPRWPASYRSKDQPGVLEIKVPLELSERLKQLAYTARVPFKSVLLAAHLRMLKRHCNQSEITTGLVTNIRPETVDADRVLGLYLNTLPFYLNLSGGTWIDLVQATFKAEQEDIAFREYPLAELQRHLGHSPFETIFNIVHFHVYQDLLEHEELNGINEKVFQRTNFPLLTSFVLDPRSAQLDRIVIDYDGHEICFEQVKAIGDSYIGILEAMAAQPESRYEMQILPPASLQMAGLGKQDNLVIPDSEVCCIHTLFEDQVERTPDAIALAFHAIESTPSIAIHLSYRELNQRANQLAHYLKSFGVGTETLVGICVERTPEMVVGILGILKAGGAYIPFDPCYPQARLAFMLEDAQIQVMITQSTLLERLPEYKGSIVCLDTEKDLVLQQSQENLVDSIKPTNLAYVLYTSGSTGQPKGVAIEHRQTANLLYWAKNTFLLEELRGVLAATSLNFDLSVFEIFAPLSWGGKVIVAENILQLPCLADQEVITLINTVPSLMTNFVIEHLPASVQVVNFAGESLKGTLVQQIYDKGTVDKVFNLYGPTEATTYATWELIEKGQTDPLTIGNPIRATEAYILDEHLQPVPIGVPGELHLGGFGIARGYLERTELTDEKFIPHPFSPEPGNRLYKTGDLARYLPDNTIEYLGRIDHQVKIRGFRIELQEIEVVLMRHTKVSNAVVIARQNTLGATYITAYLVTKETQQIPACELRSILKMYLPNYMMPEFFVTLDALPLKTNGKIDYQSLPVPVQIQSSVKLEYVAPRTLDEQKLASIWEDLLSIENVGVNDNFFELGGHSILGMEMIARAFHQGLQLTIKQLYQTPTIAAMLGKSIQ
ncbi:amino acid adenylation domain-containing protein (plasmid) [Tolypothrix sp. PCC 7910]|uniref:non-ribosomal peptide synthetase n=1 Tax=Tolypothrix sp. PCC 7910 TaxID=2099387 RepID=UPI001427739E|nr:non-ribosomal peptide synthetase [Tolypothrix sp. PCC 7910]QIR41935.1 amino acid adenylation domain-containing protein [Tolypothrix sp. PCC 7910]